MGEELLFFLTEICRIYVLAHMYRAKTSLTYIIGTHNNNIIVHSAMTPVRTVIDYTPNNSRATTSYNLTSAIVDSVENTPVVV
jgi:hypothetical protein